MRIIAYRKISQNFPYDTNTVLSLWKYQWQALEIHLMPMSFSAPCDRSGSAPISEIEFAIAITDINLNSALKRGLR